MTMIGISEAKADKYVLNLRNNLTPEDLAGVSEKDIPKYARVCANNIIKASFKADESEISGPVINDPVLHTEEVQFDESLLIDDTSTKPEEHDDSATREFTKAHITVQKETVRSEPEAQSTHIDSKEDRTDNDPVTPKSDIHYDKPAKGNKAKFIGITILASPLWIVAFAVFFAPFIIMFASEFTLTAAMICLLAGFTAFGTAASLTGIVYGIVKIFSTPAVGLYEIGFGIIIGGVAMICGILIYNGVVRFMPWLIKKSARLFKFTFSKIKPLLTEYKRRCETL